MTKIEISTLLQIDVRAIMNEASKLGKEFTQGSNDGLKQTFFINPDLTGPEKTIFLGLINKIGTGTVT